MSEQQEGARTLYIVKVNEFSIPGSQYRDAVYALIADDGEHLASHVCSSSGFARGDLHDRRADRQAEWRERFGDYRVIWVGEDDLTEEELIARNHAWHENQPAESPQRPESEGEMKTFDDAEAQWYLDALAALSADQPAESPARPEREGE